MASRVRTCAEVVCCAARWVIEQGTAMCACSNLCSTLCNHPWDSRELHLLGWENQHITIDVRRVGPMRINEITEVATR